MSDSIRFRDRVVLVTGGASGIGAAAATRFGAEGAIVYRADLRADDDAAFDIALDVTDEQSWENAIRRIVGASGGLDVLVNSAGVSFGAPIRETTLADWRRVLAVNLDGVFLGTKHALGAMSGRGGAIVNVSSASGVRPAAGASAYSTSKAAVGMFTRVAAKECRDLRPPVRVNAVAPGGVKTPLWNGMRFFTDLVAERGSEEAAYAALADMAGLGRFAQPDEVAEAILYLASDAAAIITGVELLIDGGFVL